MKIFFYLLMFVLGCIFGSFLCCEAHRFHLHASQSKSLGKRSVCLHCGHQLRWYENIPIFSWIFLRGKCRKCGKKIGYLEILSELGLGLSFLALSTTFDFANPLDFHTLMSFILLLMLVLGLGFLAIYDGKWGELPNIALTFSLICAIIIVILKYWYSFSVNEFSWLLVVETVASVAILGGLYLALYLFSKGKWVGDGDWILGTIIGLALSSPWLAIITLFLTNLLACLVTIPITTRLKKAKIRLGPFFFAAFIIVVTFADFFLNVLL